MIIETSAIIAILRNEPERRALNEAIEAAEIRLMSVVSFVEASMVMEARHGYDGVRDLDLFLAKAQIDLVPVDEAQAHMARQAFVNMAKAGMLQRSILATFFHMPSPR